jgi:hypothetical protein
MNEIVIIECLMKKVNKKMLVILNKGKCG